MDIDCAAFDVRGDAPYGLHQPLAGKDVSTVPHQEAQKVEFLDREEDRLSAHKDSALEYTVRAWCNTDDYWTVYFDLFRDVKNAFDKNGISIPYPQVDVHTKN